MLDEDSGVKDQAEGQIWTSWAWKGEVTCMPE